MDKPTLVLGASTNPDRTSFTAINKLRAHNHPVYALGHKVGTVEDVEIQTEWPQNRAFDTITIYLSPENQAMYADRIIAAQPKRVIFNPGAENPDLETRLLDYDIEVLEACTLTMIVTGQY